MALFITFEGGEGSGKSLQSRALYNRLKREGIPTLLTHEPGGTPHGEKIARWLKHTKDVNISPLTELLTFNASRAQLIEEVIQPNLKTGTTVICDRYTDSTIAYQSWGRGLDLELVKMVNNTATEGLKPALTILLDLPVETGLARKVKKGHDRFEKEDITFHEKVREGYLNLAKDEPERWLVVDGSKPIDSIKKIIWQRVIQLL